METNYKHYFGTPQKASQMTVERWNDDEGMKDGVTVWHGDELIVSLCRQDGDSFESWLEKDSGISKEPVTIAIDGAKFALAQINTVDRKMTFNIRCEVPIDDEIYRLYDFSSYRITGAIMVHEY